MTTHKGGAPKKPNALHVMEGTARTDRGTDQLMVIPPEIATDPVLFDFAEFDEKKTFDMLKDWVIAATGAAQIDSIALTMMTDQLSLYAAAKAEGDSKSMGQILDRYHKLAREFGMTPSTRDRMIKAATDEKVDAMKSVMDGFE